MRISVAVSLMFSASVLPAISTGLPPRSTTANRRSWTAKLRSVSRVTRSTIRMLRSGVRPATSLGVCAWALPQYVASASNAAAISDPRTRLIRSTGDRHVVHRDEMRHDDPDLLNRLRRRRELGPQIGAALGRNVFEVPAAQAVFVGILDDQVLFLVRGIDQIDAANKKKYLVVKDADKHCLCSRNLEHVASKSSANLWAKFPAPPESVQKIGVVVPHFIPMDDVPISR